MRLVYVFIQGTVFIRLFSEDQSSKYTAQRKRKVKSLPSPKRRDQDRLSPWCCRSRNCTEWTYAIEIHRR